MRKKTRGFTLLEMLITMIVAGIIIAIVYSSYRTSTLKSRRSDAINTLISIQAAEEKYRTSNASYGTLAQVWGGISATPQGYYTVAISNITATSYTITATAQGYQASDSGCTSIVLTKSGTSETRTPAACWQ